MDGEKLTHNRKWGGPALIRQYELIERIQVYDPNCDEDLLNKAYVFSMKGCGTRKRPNGDPYFTFPLAVAERLLQIEAHHAIIAASIVAAVDQPPPSKADLASRFGEAVARITLAVHRLAGSMESRPDDEREQFRVVVSAALAVLHQPKIQAYSSSLANAIAPIAVPADHNRVHDAGFVREWRQEDFRLKSGLLDKMASNYDLVRALSPRAFEEFVADVLIGEGYSTTLTKATRDGGYDIVARKKDGLFSMTYLVECKKYDESKRVSVDVVRRLYGVVSERNATGGMVVTSASFSDPATKFADNLGSRISLIDALRIRHLLTRAMLQSTLLG